MAIDHPVFAANRRNRFAPNAWDVVAFSLIFGGFILIALGAHGALNSLSTLAASPISLDPSNLPNYALRTTMRMFVAISAAIIFTFIYGTWAAKSRRAEAVLIPLLDILQSVPVLGFLSFTVVGFMALFPGKVLGVELASIFAIFTSQAWNMTFSFYQALKTVPGDLDEVTRSYRLTSWQRFWRLEVPFAMPGLVWNTMMSMSGGWFFVVASEAISVGHITIALPGIGSYVARAIATQNLSAVGWAVLTMLFVILLYDQLLFRPLVAWSDKFRVEMTASAAPRSWVLDAIRRTNLLRSVFRPVSSLIGMILRLRAQDPFVRRRQTSNPWVDRIWHTTIFIAFALAIWLIVAFVSTELAMGEVSRVVWLGTLTMTRVVALTALASLVWVPVGVWVGLHPRLAERAQPLAQFLAAFPANIIFPFAVVLIVRWNLDPNIWLSPLMVLGTQWYILFNVIAGASAFPNDLKEAATTFHIRGWSWWRKVILPGIFPYYVTGAITATGGAWNASIVAEVASWGKTTLTAQGLGAYIAQATEAGDYPRIVLGIAVMSLFVLLFNRLFWHPMYAYSANRLRIR